MKILLFGENGGLGWELRRSLSVLGDVVVAGRIYDNDRIETLMDCYMPEVVVNAMAYTNVEEAETEGMEEAYLVNALYPKVIAEKAREIGALFVHYSTDYVFDGGKDGLYKEIDYADPINEYGMSKLRGELNVLESDCEYLIIRSSWLYGFSRFHSMRRPGFVQKILRQALLQDEMKVVDDQIGSPTWVRNLADATAHLIMMGNAKNTILNVACGGSVSRYLFAKVILSLDKQRDHHSVKEVIPVKSWEYPMAAPRPRNTALDCSKVESYGLRMPWWTDALKLAME